MNEWARIGVLVFAVINVSAAIGASADRWPTKPAKIIVATPPGGGDDFLARLLAPKLSELLGQPFMAENRPGGGGLVAQNYVAKAAPDGYTWIMAGGSAMAGARYVNTAAKHDVLRDFAPISLIETSPFVLLIHPAVPAATAKDYVALARRQPDKITFATLGPGQMPYWSAHLFNSLAGIKALEVQYKAFGELTSDLIAGRVDYFFAPSATAAGLKGKLRPIAVTTLRRSILLPDIPTLAETAVPGYDMPAWRSIMGPAGIAREIVDPLHTALARALASADVRERMHSVGSEAALSTPEELTQRYALWIERFGSIARQAGIKPL